MNKKLLIFGLIFLALVSFATAYEVIDFGTNNVIFADSFNESDSSTVTEADTNQSYTFTTYGNITNKTLRMYSAVAGYQGVGWNSTQYMGTSNYSSQFLVRMVSRTTSCGYNPTPVDRGTAVTVMLYEASADTWNYYDGSVKNFAGTYNQNQWYYFQQNFNTATSKMTVSSFYLNKTFIMTQSFTEVQLPADNYIGFFFSINKIYLEVDDIMVWNSSRFNGGYPNTSNPYSPPPTTYSPNFTSMGYNETNNTLPRLLNFTCGNNVSNLWFGITNPPTSLVLNQTLFGNYTLDSSNIISNKTYYYLAGCNGSSNLNSSVFYFHYDADIPKIVFNDYDSTVYDSKNNTCINYTVSDMFLSYANFSIIGVNPAFMNETNLTVSNKTFYQCYNFINQSLGNYEIKVCAKDSYSNSPEMDFSIKDNVTNYKIETEFLDKKNNIKFKRNVEILENLAIQEINKECYINNDFSDKIHIKSSFNCQFADKEKIKITYSCIDGCTGFRFLSDRGKSRLIDSSGNIMVSFEDDEARGRIVEYTQNAGLTETIITPAQSEKNDFIAIGDIVNGLNTNCESVFIDYAVAIIPDEFTEDEKMFILWIMLIILGIAIILTLIIKIVLMYLITALLFFFSAIVVYYALPNDINFNVIICVFMAVFGLCILLYGIFYRR